MAGNGLPGASGTGRVRTDMDCHACNKTFLAVLDFSVTGNHTIVCPRCGHEHCRTIVDGVVTGERWDSRYQRVDQAPGSVWSSPEVQATTSVAALFIRDSWLNFGHKEEGHL